MILASRPHYADHLGPIAFAAHGHIPEDVALVASYHDYIEARRRKPRAIILAQHGVGQSYGGDPRTAHLPGYPGGSENDDVGLFLVPNDHAGDRWREAYPNASVAVVGSPRLDYLPRRAHWPDVMNDRPTVAVSFHWDNPTSPETRSAWAWMLPGLAALAKSPYAVIGHAHPRRPNMPSAYRRQGIEYVASFEEVCRRADVLVADNTSILYEFAATGRPVVAMNAPWYRRDIRHGLRFWGAIPGRTVDHPSDLVDAVTRALLLEPDDVANRERALDIAYAYRTGAAERAAAAIREFLG